MCALKSRGMSVVSFISGAYGGTPFFQTGIFCCSIQRFYTNSHKSLILFYGSFLNFGTNSYKLIHTINLQIVQYEFVHGVVFVPIHTIVIQIVQYEFVHGVVFVPIHTIVIQIVQYAFVYGVVFVPIQTIFIRIVQYEFIQSAYARRKE